MVQPSAAIKHYLGDLLLLGFLGDKLADRFGAHRFGAFDPFEFLFVRADQGAPGRVVYDLTNYMMQAARHGQPGPAWSTDDPGTDPTFPSSES